MYRGLNLKNSGLTGLLSYAPGERPYTIQKISSTDSLMEKKITIKVVSNDSELDLEAEFLPGVSQLYHNTTIFYPLEPKETKGSETLGLPSYEFYDRFNYGSEAYSEFVLDKREIDLPNFYLSQYNEENDKYADIFAFENSIGSREFFNDELLLNQNYKSRSEQQTQVLRNVFLARNAERYGESERSRFPYAVDIKLTFRDRDFLSTTLDLFKLHKSSISVIDSLPKTNVTFDVTLKDFESEQNSVLDIPVASVEDFINYAYYPKVDSFVCLPDDLDRSRYIANMNKIRMNRGYNKVALNMLPSIFDIFGGSNVKNEILYIKIEKFLGAQPAGDPIQSIWLRDASRPSSQDPSIQTYGNYDYYDTQVKIGETYSYVIKAYVVVYGAEVTCDSVNQQSKTVDLTLRPSYKIVEVELATKTIAVLQPLQLPPYVFPYFHSKLNRISFYLQLQRGQKFMDYITFEPQDQEFFDNIMSTTQYKKPEHAYTFEPATFEVYRLEKKPLKLEDFSGNKIAEVQRDGVSISANFSEYVVYEKDYYYMFRALNTVGYPGNPSKIYRVRLSKGLTKNEMQVEIIDLKERAREYDGEKEFTKLLHIRPNLADGFIDTLETEELTSYRDNIDKVKLGVDNNSSVWGKRYKIRLHSKNSGRKIDINVNFKINKKV